MAANPEGDRSPLGAALEGRLWWTREAASAQLQAGSRVDSSPARATPVQKLNRDGVKELQKHRLERAEKLFYRAYLIDPEDPFTLNNLGYISELQGKVDRAQRYYELAAKENNSETVIAEASARKLE